MPHIKAKENNNNKLYSISNGRGIHTITAQNEAYGTTLRDHRNNNNDNNNKNHNSNEKWVNRVGLKTQKFAAVESVSGRPQRKHFA